METLEIIDLRIYVIARIVSCGIVITYECLIRKARSNIKICIVLFYWNVRFIDVIKSINWSTRI